jgi:hypothetical protein
MRKLALAAALMLATTAPVYAQAQCGRLDQVYEVLSNKYDERRIGLGLAPQGIVEVWVNSETGSFTILGVTPSGMACLLANGENFEFQEDNYKRKPNL